ncbi:TPA: HAMP domain-containing histidine kinase [Klebsiella pneumoniae]|nr:HAMP domain-containing histidine kinase [Klebsiella pneumoniae]
MRQFFKTLLGQILVIITGSTLFTFLLLSTLLFFPKGPPGPPWPWQTTYRLASTIKLLQSTQPGLQEIVLRSAQYDSGLKYKLIDTPTPCSHKTFNTWDLTKTLTYELGDTMPVTVASCNASDNRKDIQVLIRIGNRYLDARVANIGREPTRFTFPTFCAILFLLTGIAIMSLWAISRIISPLRELAEKADAFSRDVTVVPVKEGGPSEIRRVATTFNLMQERVAQHMKSRSQMLAAISHDLRSPLTRMRLNLESNPSEATRDKLIRDIDLMNKLIGSALTFIRTGSDGETSEWVDLDALMLTLCDEYEDAGIAISYSGPAAMLLLCKPDAIQRVMTNLIDNAAAHAEIVSIRASQTDCEILIEVNDNGPGIPEMMLERVQEPFYRMDTARNERKGSAGLGLSIVREIVSLHGGVFELVNRDPHGLSAKISLPKSLNPRRS